MPLTSSRGFAALIAAYSRLLRAVARRDLLLRRVGLRRRLDQRPQHLVVGFQPVGGVAPLLAVPGVDAPAMHALVVPAGRLQRLHRVGEPGRLDLRGAERQVLRAPAHFLAGHAALAAPALPRLHAPDRAPRRAPAPVVAAPTDLGLPGRRPPAL